MKDSFQSEIENAVSFFSSLEKGPVRLISHHDADGICSAALMVILLNKLDISYSISIVPSLKKSFIESLSRENYETFIFTDVGATQINEISENLADKNVLILDHHQTTLKEKGRIVHVNPNKNGEYNNDISGAGVVYNFAYNVTPEIKRYGHLPIIGAIGDCQERNGFNGRNKELLESAEKEGTIRVYESLRLFGAKTKPLTKLLKQNYDPYIAGVSGSFRGTVKFLQELGIEHRVNNKQKMLDDLSTGERERLIKGLENKLPKNKGITGKVYTIPNERGAFADAREFSTILNSCGRMEEATTGLAACLGDNKMKAKAEDVLKSYKRELQAIIDWFRENRNSEDIREGSNYIIINTKDRTLSSIAGTFASMISFSNYIEKGTLILTMSRSDDNTTKASLRMAGGTHNTKTNLNEIMRKIINSTGGEFGGHANAAGANIEISKEKKFIEEAERVFEEEGIMEKIVSHE
ncbi:MAG: DHH family phosphoesterase [Nanoarchaeota archaeon]